MQNLTSPVLLINKHRALLNIETMYRKAVANNLLFRPHFKTHQSLEVGRWFRQAGTKAITVSSLSMAEFFAADGWDDITIAFPVNPAEIPSINELAGKITLHVITTSADVVHMLDEELTNPLNCWLEIDTGDRRSGLWFEEQEQAVVISANIIRSGKLRFGGIITHAGRTYRCRTAEEIQAVHAESLTRMVGLKEVLETTLHTMVNISIGDTPSCSVAENFDEADEIRCGNFVYYDLMQLQIGSCKEEEIAVGLSCPVVDIHPERSEVIVHGGAVHLSKDVLTEGGVTHFGRIALSGKNGWGKLLDGCYVKSISQEHGIVRLTSEVIKKIRVGDRLIIVPVHSCLTADLMRREFMVI